MKAQYRETPFFVLLAVAAVVAAGGFTLAGKWIECDRLTHENERLVHQIGIEVSKRQDQKAKYDDRISDLYAEIRQLRTMEYTVQARPPEVFDDSDERVVEAYDRAMSVVAGASSESKRSPHWPTVRNKFAAEHPECCVCSAKTQVIHHVETFATHPDKELDPDNLVALCDRCHLLIGHLGNFQNVNPDVRKHIDIIHKAKEKADAIREMKHISKSTIAP